MANNLSLCSGHMNLRSANARLLLQYHNGDELVGIADAVKDNNYLRRYLAGTDFAAAVPDKPKSGGFFITHHITDIPDGRIFVMRYIRKDEGEAWPRVRTVVGKTREQAALWSVEFRLPRNMEVDLTKISITGRFDILSVDELRSLVRSTAGVSVESIIDSEENDVPGLVELVKLEHEIEAAPKFKQIKIKTEHGERVRLVKKTVRKLKITR